MPGSLNEILPDPIGVENEESLLDLSITRGQLMAAAGKNENLPEGAMLAVQAPIPQLEALAENSTPKIVIANRNSPRQGVY